MSFTWPWQTDYLAGADEISGLGARSVLKQHGFAFDETVAMDASYYRIDTEDLAQQLIIDFSIAKPTYTGRETAMGFRGVVCNHFAVLDYAAGIKAMVKRGWDLQPCIGLNAFISVDGIPHLDAFAITKQWGYRVFDAQNNRFVDAHSVMRTPGWALL